MSLRFTRDKWVQMKKLAAFVLWPNLTKRCKFPFFLVNEYGVSSFFLVPKKEAAVGNMLKYVLAINNVPLLLKECGDPTC